MKRRTILMWKRILIGLLCFVMCIGIMPTMTFAAKGDTVTIGLESASNTVMKSPSDFAIGKLGTDSFLMNMSFKTSEGSVCVIHIPYGFEMTGGFENLDSKTNKTVTGSYKDPKGTTITFIPSVSAVEMAANFTIKQYPSMLVENLTSNTVYDFTITTYDAADTTFSTPAATNKMELLGDSTQPVYTVTSVAHDWTPYEAAFLRTNTHSRQGAQRTGYYWPSQLQVQPTVSVTKTAGVMLPDSTISMELPYKKLKKTKYDNNTNPNGYNTGAYAGDNSPSITPYINVNGSWYYAGSLFTVKPVFDADGYLTNATLIMNESSYDKFSHDFGDGTKSNLEILTEACEIQIRVGGEIQYENANQFLTNQPEGGYVASTNPSLQYTKLDKTTDTVTAAEPMKFKVVNGTDKTLKLAVMTPSSSVAMNSTTSDGYASTFTVGNGKDYAILQNVHISYEYPYEYSPVEFTLFPDTSFQKADFNYTFTISDANGVNRTETVTYASAFGGAVGYNYVYTPTLAANEWVSKVDLRIPEYWKSESGTVVTAYKANYRATEQDISGNLLSNPYTATITGTSEADGVDAGTTSGTATLVRIKDDLEYFTLNKSSLYNASSLYTSMVNIGYYHAGSSYDELQTPFIRFDWTKYTDTKAYENCYFEVTGDALALLKGVNDQVEGYSLPLTAYRLETGDWVEVTADQLAEWQNADGYVDLTQTVDFSQHYLTGVRLSAVYLNDYQVTDRSGQHTFTLNLYLHDSVLPTDAGMKALGNFPQRDTYASDKEYYAACDSWKNAWSYAVSFAPDGTKATTSNLSTTKTGDTYKAYSSTLQLGAIAGLTDKAHDYYVGSVGNVAYDAAELCQVRYDDTDTTYGTYNNQLAYVQDTVWNFENTTDSEKAMLALTKGVTLSATDASYYNWYHFRNDSIWYKTNQKDSWQVIPNTAYHNSTGYRQTRVYVPITLADGEYITALQVHAQPYQGLTYGGSLNRDRGCTKVISDVGLCFAGKVPTSMELDNGDTYTFTDGDQLPYTATLSVNDVLGRETVQTFSSETAKLNSASQYIEANAYTVTGITYQSNQSNQSQVNQGNTTTATVNLNYNVGNGAIDTTRQLRPAFYFEISSAFTPTDLKAIADQYHAVVTFDKKESGNGILKIELTEDSDSIERGKTTQFSFALRARPNATTGQVSPIVNSWMDVDYDQSIPYNVNNYGVKMTEDTANKCFYTDTDGSVSGETGKTLLHTTATFTSWATTVMQFVQTGVNTLATAGGTGYTQEVSNYDDNQNNIFGMNQILGGATDVSTSSWSVYIKLPQKGEKSAYYDDTLAERFQETEESDFTLVLYDEVTVTGITGAKVLYSTSDSPSMKGLTSLTDSETEGDWKTWDSIQEKNTIKYLKLSVPTVGVKEQIMYDIPLRLADRKDTIGTQHAYPTVWYNYERDGQLTWQSSNPLARGGGMCGKLTYDLQDYLMSGSLFCDNNRNSIFDSGDTYGGADMTVALQSDPANTPVKNADGTDYIYNVGTDGKFAVSVPRADNFSLVMTPPKRSIVSEQYAANGKEGNWSWFQPNATKSIGIYQTKVTKDIHGILGGYIPAPDPASVEIAGTKTLTGSDKTTDGITAGQFGFTVTRTDQGSGEMTGLPDGSVEVQAGGALDFGTWTFLDAGTYTFKIAENAVAAGYTRAADTTVTVTVTLNEATNKLEAAVTYSSGDTLTIANVYTAPAATDAAITGSKTLSGGGKTTADITENQFGFTVTRTDTNGKTVTGVPDGTVYAQAGTGALDFGTWSFDKVGQYTFRVSENDVTAGYTKAEDVFVAVDIGLDTATNTLTKAVTCQNAEGQPTTLTFANTYSAPAPVGAAITGQSTLTGGGKTTADIRKEQFSFTVTADADNPAGSAAGIPDRIQTAAGGALDLGTWTFSKPGTYVFTVAEDTPGTGYTKGKDVTVTVQVVLNTETNQLEKTITYSSGESLTIDNTYTAPAAVTETVNGTVTLTEEGETLPVSKDQFICRLAADAGNDTTGYRNVETDAAGTQTDGSFAFDAITFTKEGTYTFTITQEKKGAAGYTYDEAVYHAAVKVTYNESANELETALSLTKEVQGKETAADTILFANSYQPEPVKNDPPVEKRITGNPDGAADFTFILKAADSNNPMPADSQNGIKEVTRTGAGAVEFGDITFTKEGTYIYTISEKNTGNSDYEYDTDTYTLIYAVTDEQGSLAAVRTIMAGGLKADKAVFTNRYSSQTTTGSTDHTTAVSTTSAAAATSDTAGVTAVTSAANAELTETGVNPPTGDRANAPLYAILGFFALAAGMGILIAGKRKQTK